MNTIIQRNARLKKQLVKRINDIDNGEILNQIAQLVHLDVKFDEVYVMSPAEIEALEDGLNQIKNGQWISDEDVRKTLDKWFQ